MSHSSSPSSWSLDEVASVDVENDADSLPAIDRDDGDFACLIGDGSGDAYTDESVDARRGEKSAEDDAACGADALRTCEIGCGRGEGGLDCGVRLGPDGWLWGGVGRFVVTASGEGLASCVGGSGNWRAASRMAVAWPSALLSGRSRRDDGVPDPS